MKARRAQFRTTGGMDPSWRKSRVLARILLRDEAGTLTAQDCRVAKRLANDPDVENRLIDQAMAWFRAEKKA